MKRVLLGSGIVVSMFLMSIVARAGLKETGDNYVYTDGSTYAEGSVGDARASSDGNQYIGCTIDTYSTGVPVVGCFARNAAGTGIGCSTTNANFVAVAAGITANSYLAFDASSGTCTFLEVADYSYFTPTTP